MATETWNGGIGDWYDPSQWTAGQIPIAGDSAYLPGGTVHLDGVDARQIAIDDGWNTAALDKDATLDIGNSVLGTIYLQGGNPVTPHGTPIAVFNIHGVAIFTGPITPVDAGEGVSLTVNMAPASVLINTGYWRLQFEGQAYVTIDMSAADILVNRGTMDFGGEASGGNLLITGAQNNGILVNSGTMILGGNATIDAAVIGGGTFELAGQPFTGESVDVEFKGLVGSGTTLGFVSRDVTDYAGSEERLVIDQAHEFMGTITGFGTGDELVLPGVTATSVQFNGGVLTLSDAHGPVAALHVTGSYTSSSFSLSTSNGATIVQHSP